MATATSEVIRVLTGFGRLVDQFVQANEGQRLRAGQVDEGFCNGVCTDWARRVLQGGRAAFTQKEERKGSQTQRQATVQLQIESMNDAQNAVIVARNDLVRLSNQHLDGSPVPIPRNLEAKLREYINFTPTPNSTYDYDRVARWLTILAEVRDSYDHTADTGFIQFVQAMDARHLQSRRDQERDGSNRTFSNLRIVASEKSANYTPVSNGINRVLRLPTFVAGTVEILGFGLRSANSTAGHAVALHRVGDDSYHFLDPNYGVFAYDLTSARSALYYLFGTHYGTPIYGEDGCRVTGNLGYTLIGVAN